MGSIGFVSRWRRLRRGPHQCPAAVSFYVWHLIQFDDGITHRHDHVARSRLTDSKCRFVADRTRIPAADFRCC